ncbi:MAG: c-type cytochrome [Acidobacteriota bacterium]
MTPFKKKVKVAITLVFASFACIFFSSPGKTQTQTETAGHRFKNIKVLNDMPADQLGKVMNIFSASLGVNCDFCHIGEDFAKDGKKEKDTAREMIKMTFAINRDNFRSRPEVSCNSCHNGREHPQSVPNLNPVASDERPKQPAAKPTADQIVSKYLDALGGAAKLQEITSRSFVITRVEPDGKTTETETAWFKTGKYIAKTTYGSIVVSEGFDGAKGWKAGNKDAIWMKPDESEQLKREADLFSPANLKAIYPTMEFRFLDRINGRAADLVFATSANGTRERLWFDAQTGLLIRRSAATPTILGNFVYQVDYSDYKNFGGVKIPTVVRYAMPNIRWTRKIMSVKTNVSLDDALFNAPKP